MNPESRQWAVGQLVNDGKRWMLLVGNDNNIYQGCLLYVDAQGKVGTMSIKFYRTYSGLIVKQTDLIYSYASQEQIKRDIPLFLPYFKGLADGPANS